MRRFPLSGHSVIRRVPGDAFARCGQHESNAQTGGPEPGVAGAVAGRRSATGIRNFIVLRDGQEIAQVPENPIGKFGRPLFQSMTYHDTPSQPMPEMRFVDATAKAGEKHSYTIITVNSVGLKSVPSRESTTVNQTA